jgi:hypothetical protein
MQVKHAAVLREARTARTDEERKAKTAEASQLLTQMQSMAG